MDEPSPYDTFSLDGPDHKLRGRTMTIAANVAERIHGITHIRHRSDEQNEIIIPEDQLRPQDILPVWKQPRQIMTPTVLSQARHLSSNTGVCAATATFDRASAVPPPNIADNHLNPFFMSETPEEVKHQMCLESEAVASKRRRHDGDPHKSFLPYFKRAGIIPQNITKNDKQTMALVHHSARHMRSAQDEPRIEHRPKPTKAVVPTFVATYPYRSPFYPQDDMPELKNTTVQQLGMGRGGPIGSGIHMPLKELPPNFDPDSPRHTDPLYDDITVPVPSTPQEVPAGILKKRKRTPPMQTRFTGEHRFGNIVPEDVPLPDTPRKQNPGAFSTDTPKVASAGRYKSDLEVVKEKDEDKEDMPDAPDSPTPQRQRTISFSFPKSPKGRKSSSATIKFPSFGRSVAFDNALDDNSDQEGAQEDEVFRTPKRGLKRRTATGLSKLANFVNKPDMALKYATIANTGSPRRTSSPLVEQPNFRKRALTAGKDAIDATMDVLKSTTENLLHRRISDPDKDKFGNNWGRVTKAERAPKDWDPAKPKYSNPMTPDDWPLPPTPRGPGSQWGFSPRKTTKMRRQSQAVRRNSIHDAKYIGLATSNTTSDNAIGECHGRGLGLFMSDRKAGKQPGILPHHGQDADDTLAEINEPFVMSERQRGKQPEILHYHVQDADDTLAEINEPFVMSERQRGKQPATLPHHGQDADDTTLTEITEPFPPMEFDTETDTDVEDHLQEAEHNRELFQHQEPSSSHGAVLHRDPHDPFVDATSTHRKRTHSPVIKRRPSSPSKQSVSIMKRSGTMKSSNTAKSRFFIHSFKGALTHGLTHAKEKVLHPFSSPHRPKSPKSFKRGTKDGDRGSVSGFQRTKAKIFGSTFGSSPHDNKLRKSSKRGTRYEDGLDNPGGSFRVGSVKNIATVTQLSSPHTRFPSGTPFPKVSPPPSPSPEGNGKGKAKEEDFVPREEYHAPDTIIPIGNCGEYVPANEILGSHPRSPSPEADWGQLGGHRKISGFQPPRPRDRSHNAVAFLGLIEAMMSARGRGRGASTSSSSSRESLQMTLEQSRLEDEEEEERNLQMALELSRDPANNVVVASGSGQAGPGPRTAAAREEARERGKRERSESAVTVVYRPNFGHDGYDEDDARPRKRSKFSPSPPAEPPTRKRSRDEVGESWDEMMARKNRRDELEMANRRRYTADVATWAISRDEDGDGGIGQTDGAAFSRPRDDENLELGHRPSRLHPNRRRQYQESQRLLREQREAHLRETEMARHAEVEAWVRQRQSESVAAGLTPFVPNQLANEMRIELELERLRVITEAQDREERRQAKARAEELRRQGEVEALDRLREVHPEEAQDEDGRRTEFVAPKSDHDPPRRSGRAPAP